MWQGPFIKICSWINSRNGNVYIFFCPSGLLLPFSFAQLEHDIDSIFLVTGLFVQAVDNWTTKWAPAIHSMGTPLLGITLQ